MIMMMTRDWCQSERAAGSNDLAAAAATVTVTAAPAPPAAACHCHAGAAAAVPGTVTVPGGSLSGPGPGPQPGLWPPRPCRTAVLKPRPQLNSLSALDSDHSNRLSESLARSPQPGLRDAAGSTSTSLRLGTGDDSSVSDPRGASLSECGPVHRDSGSGCRAVTRGLHGARASRTRTCRSQSARPRPGVAVTGTVTAR